MFHVCCFVRFFFFFNDTATTEIYTYGHTLSLHDALPISTRAANAPRPRPRPQQCQQGAARSKSECCAAASKARSVFSKIDRDRSEEHTSELQSLMRSSYAVFCLKKKKQKIINHNE